MAYCKNCGQFLPDNAVSCNNCGVSVQKPQAQYQSYQQSNQNQYQQNNYQQPNQYQQNNYQQPNQYQQNNYQQPNQYQQNNYQQPNQYQQNNYQQPNQYQQNNYQQPNQYQQNNYQQSNPYQQYDKVQNNVNNVVNKFLNTNDHTQEIDPRDAEENFVFALLSYIGILFLIPLFARKDSRFCKFHVNNGLILCIIEAVVSIISVVLHAVIRLLFSRDVTLYGVYLYSELNGFGKFLSVIVTIITSIIGLVCFILAIIGIVNAVQRRAKDLPIIGKFKILK